MLSSVQMSELLEAQDPVLFTGEVSALENAAFELASSDFEGIALALPETLSADIQQPFPILVFSRVNRLRDWQVSRLHNTVLIVITHHGANIQTRPFFKEELDRERQGPYPGLAKRPMPSEEMASAITTSLRQIDLKQCFSLPQAGQSLCLVALCFDQASNLISAKMPGQPTLSEPLTVSLGSALLRKAKILPQYDQTSESPCLPAQGLNFTITASEWVKPHGFTIRGAFNKLARMHEIKNAPELMQFGQVKHLVVAVVPIVFIVLVLNSTVPFISTWNFPVYGNDLPAIGSLLKGFFEFEMFAPEEIGFASGEKVIYALMDNELFGPVSF